MAIVTPVTAEVPAEKKEKKEKKGKKKKDAYVWKMPALTGDNSIDVVMWGNIPSGHMPAMMNCIDVLVLPSRNEGLPLVCAEAIKCGAYAVGADVGGVAEVVGKDNAFPHGECFVTSIASKIVSVLKNGGEQAVPAHLDWAVTAEKEIYYINYLLP